MLDSFHFLRVHLESSDTYCCDFRQVKFAWCGTRKVVISDAFVNATDHSRPKQRGFTAEKNLFSHRFVFSRHASTSAILRFSLLKNFSSMSIHFLWPLLLSGSQRCSSLTQRHWGEGWVTPWTSSQINTGPISASHLIKLHFMLRCHIFLPEIYQKNPTTQQQYTSLQHLWQKNAYIYMSSWGSENVLAGQHDNEARRNVFLALAVLDCVLCSNSASCCLFFFFFLSSSLLLEIQLYAEW